ncbi:MAG: ABC transporter ATP-binding protein [Rhizomicrobium sp.]
MTRVFQAALQALGYRRAAAAVASVLLSAALELLSVLLLRSYFLLLLGHQIGNSPEGSTWQLFFGKPPNLLFVGVCLLAFFLVKSLMLAAIWRALLGLLAVQQANVTTQLFEVYLRTAYRSRQQWSRPLLQQKLHVAATGLFHELLFPALLLAADGTAAAAIFLYLLVLEPLPTLAVGLWLAFAVFVYQGITHKASVASGRQRWRGLERMMHLASDSLGDIVSVMLMAHERFLSAAFGVVAGEYATALAADRFFALMPRFVFEFLVVGTIVVLIVFMPSGQSGAVPVLTLFAAATLRLAPAIQRVMTVGHALRVNRPDMRSIFADLSQRPPELPERPQGHLPAPFERTMELKNVVCGYDGKTILSGFDFTLHRSETVVITGPSGAGKTTFLNTILGLVVPAEGTVLIDGATQELLPRMRVSSVAYVPQKVFVLDGTLAQNIAFDDAAGKVDEGYIRELLDLVGLDARFRDEPLCLETHVGEDGVKLSGGERQRLALARALYSRPSFLVLDEATSQLDGETEARIYEVINRVLPGATILAVTHRPVPAGFFHRKFLLRDGRLTEVAAPTEKAQIDAMAPVRRSSN